MSTPPSAHPRTRTAGRVSMLLGLALVPGLLITALGLSDVASLMTLACLGALLPALLAPMRIAVATVVFTAVASAMAIPAATDPWLAAGLLAATGAAVGLSARVGASGTVILAAIGIVFLVATPPDTAGLDGPVWLVVGLLAGAASLWGAGAGLLIRRFHHASAGTTSGAAPPHAGLSRSRVGIFAAVLAVTLGTSAWVVVEFDWAHGGGWFVMTFLIVLQPYLQDAWSKTVQRATGTVMGIALAMGIYGVLQASPVALYVVGAASAVFALTIRFTTSRPYWQYVALLTPAVVLLEGVRTSVVDTAAARIGFTLLAAGIAIGIEALMLPAVKRSAQRHHVDHY
ncbi:MAG: FUSC family protein [Candidatus Nanopelagicales bacterium]